MPRSNLVMPSIRMGEMDACFDGTLRCLLGSCIGVALYDRDHMVGGLAHIVLPESRNKAESLGKYADTAIPLLIDRVQELTDAKLRLRAKIAGGANMFRTKAADPIGVQNVVAIEKLLSELKIPIRGRHCGGTQGRRMTLNAATGVVDIDIVGSETISI